MSTNDSVALPQSMRQRRILDVAEANPTASVAELASMVSSATPELVERVLDRHGDPCADGGTVVASTDGEPGSSGSLSSDSDTATLPDPTDSTPDMGAVDTEPGSSEAADTEPVSDRYPTVDELSEKQREVLRGVAAQPTATQRELGEHFGLSGTTINNRVNSIPGFEWADREAFVDGLFDERPSIDMHSSDTTSTGTAAEETTPPEPPAQPITDEASTAAISALGTAVDRLTERLDELEATASNIDPAFEDPELVHKVVHACMNAETISEAEELRILQALLR